AGDGHHHPRQEPRAPAARRRHRLLARLTGDRLPCGRREPPHPRMHLNHQAKEPIMNKIVSRGLWTVLATGGFMALGVGVAHADTTTDGTESIGSGNQGLLGISIPITVSGNSISLIGNSSSSGSETTVTESAPTQTATTSGLGSLLGGNQLLAG